MKHATAIKNAFAPLDLYISVEELEVPAVSRLYSLSPIGLGTGMVESLTSYTARLAQAHQVTPAQLLTKEIFPLLSELPPEVRIGATKFRFSDHNGFSGCSKPATFLTAALERLTLRSDLGSLSMLRWRGAIAGVSLSKRVRAWCAQCFSDWQQQGRIIFEPLIWTINLVTACATHHSRLTTECPACDKRSSPLEGRSRIGYCAKCGAWLGRTCTRSRTSKCISTNSTSDLPPEFIANQLLAALETVDKPVDQPTLATRISTTLKQRGWSNLAFMCAAGMQQWQFFSPRYARCGAPLKVLLIICHRGEINLKDLLHPQATLPSVPPVIISKPAPDFRKWKKKTYIDALRSALETALAETFPTPLNRIATGFKCESHHLRQRFPQLCHQIDLKRKRFRVRRRRQLANLLNKALREREPQSITALAERMGISYGALYKTFPREAGQLSARYQAFKKQSSIAKKNAAAALISEAAYTLHGQGKYPSVRRVLTVLDWKRTRENDIFVRGILTDVRNRLGLTKRDFARALLQ